jgi:hypothetical protein
LPDRLDDAQLETLLFPPLPDVPSDQRPVPDWSAVHRGLRRLGSTSAASVIETRVIDLPTPGRG